MDVAVLPVPASIVADESLLIDAYSPAPTDNHAAKITATVAQDVFVVGYPYGLETGFMMPLWTRAPSPLNRPCTTPIEGKTYLS